MPWWADANTMDGLNIHGALVDELTRLGLIDSTLLIIGSDHGQEWDQLQRVPLVIRFPQGQHAGRVRTNVQNLDIAPTLLDYLGMDQPAWMRGTSLLAGEIPQRPIFGVDRIKRKVEDDGDFAVSPEDQKPPFYQFPGLSVIYCQRWYLSSDASALQQSTYGKGNRRICGW